MNSIQRLFVLGASGVSFLLLAVVSGCVTDGTGTTGAAAGRSEGPTVTISVVSSPSTIRVLADDTYAGDTPARVVALVDAEGRLAYDLDITADFSRTSTARVLGASAPSAVYVRLRKGQVPPAQVSFDQRRGTLTGQVTALNPAGTRATAAGRVGERDPEVSLQTRAATLADPQAAPAQTGGRGGAGFGGFGTGGTTGRGGQ